MRLTRRCSWGIALVAVALFTVSVVHIIAERMTRESPNYSKIEEGLWLGGYVPAPPPGSQAILNLCEVEDPYHVESQRWEPIRDAEPAPSIDWLREQVGFIETECAAGRVVYVHCRNGVSRSALVVTAYLMKRDNWSRDQTLDFIRVRRPEVRPNPAFMRLLLDWEKVLRE